MVAGRTTTPVTVCVGLASVVGRNLKMYTAGPKSAGMKNACVISFP